MSKHFLKVVDRMVTESLEKEFFERTQLWKFIDPQDALLIACGVNSLDKIEEYRKKLGEINAELQEYLTQTECSAPQQSKEVRTLFGIYEFVRREREHYGADAPIGLDAVIDLQQTTGANGTCLAIANFLYVLAVMNEILLKYHLSIDSEHVMLVLEQKDSIIYVDPLHANQFDVEPLDDGENVDLGHALAAVYTERAQVLEKDPYKKNDLLRRALVLAPQSVIVYNEIAALYLKYKGDIKIAEHFARRAMEIDQGKHPRLAVNLASVYRETGRSNEARSLLEEVLEKVPDCVPAKELLQKL